MSCLHKDLKFNSGDPKCIKCNTYLWDMPDEEVRRLCPDSAEYLIENRNKLKGAWRPNKYYASVDENGEITSIKEAY